MLMKYVQAVCLKSIKTHFLMCALKLDGFSENSLFEKFALGYNGETSCPTPGVGHLFADLF